MCDSARIVFDANCSGCAIVPAEPDGGYAVGFVCLELRQWHWTTCQ